jgi:hypothetical protein
MNKIYIGIDIGKSGAIAIISRYGIVTHEMPKISNELDYHSLNKILRSYVTHSSLDSEKPYVIFEKLGVIFGSGKSTAFSMGHQSGAVEMSCVANDIPYTKVRAVDWQKQMFQGVQEITKTGSSKKDTKAMALVAIKRIFPDLKLTFGTRATKPHDGLVDAVLMAEYARRNNL